MNHMQSLKFENKLYASVKEKMEEMQQHNMSWIEVHKLNTLLSLYKNFLPLSATTITFLKISFTLSSVT